MEKSDETLMGEYQEGSSDALEELFGRYKAKVFNFAYRILSDRAEAEDATSDLFLTLLSKSGAYSARPLAKFSTWAYTVVRNGCLSRLRKRRGWLSFSQEQDPQGEGELVEWQVADAGPGPGEQAQRKDLGQWVQAAVKQLPLSQKEAIVLREYHGLSYAEIAQVLGCSMENVKILIFRAREALRKELAPLLKEGDA